MNDFKWEEVLIYSLIALASSIIKYIYKLSKGVKYSLLTLISDLLVSGFAGVLTFLVCAYFHIDPLLVSAACGISGWSGSRIVEELENQLIERIRRGKDK